MMLERVAKAIYRESVGPAQWDAWETFTPDAWGRVRSMAQARAAIEAMREMIDAALADAGHHHGTETEIVTTAGNRKPDNSENDGNPPDNPRSMS
jgi:hypothetical protein